MTFPPPVVALAELAKVLGVSRVRAMQLIKRAEFPQPIAVLSVGGSGPMTRLSSTARAPEEGPSAVGGMTAGAATRRGRGDWACPTPT